MKLSSIFLLSCFLLFLNLNCSTTQTRTTESVPPKEYLETELPSEKPGNSKIKRKGTGNIQEALAYPDRYDALNLLHRTVEPRSLLDSIYKVKNLRRLDVGNKQLTRLPMKIHELPIQKMLLSGNRFSEWPSEIFGMSQIQTLNFSGNQLRDVPDDIGKMQHLEVLWLFQNDIRHVSSEIGKLNQLNALYLNTNFISSLPLSMNNLKKLNVLSLGSNVIDHFPQKGLRLEALKDLRFAAMHLDKRRNISRVSQEDQLIRSNTLEITDDIIHYQNLEKISIAFYEKIILSESIFQLKKVRILELYSNNLTQLSDQLGKLSGLEMLLLGENKLSSLPTSLGQLKNLRILDIKGNNFSEAYIKQLKESLPNVNIMN